MALLDKIGEIFQKALFSTTLGDILEAIDGIKERIEALDGKVNQEVATLREELKEAEKRLQAAQEENKGKK